MFYDKNEQHRMLAEDVEDYLRSIYKTAEFVVVLLGTEYPKRVWARFASDQFELRFKSGAVVPVWFSNVAPEGRRVGGVTFDRGGSTAIRDAIAELLGRRIGEKRSKAAAGPCGAHLDGTGMSPE